MHRRATPPTTPCPGRFGRSPTTTRSSRTVLDPFEDEYRGGCADGHVQQQRAGCRENQGWVQHRRHRGVPGRVEPPSSTTTCCARSTPARLLTGTTWHPPSATPRASPLTAPRIWSRSPLDRTALSTTRPPSPTASTAGPTFTTRRFAGQVALDGGGSLTPHRRHSTWPRIHRPPVDDPRRDQPRFATT